MGSGLPLGTDGRAAVGALVLATLAGFPRTAAASEGTGAEVAALAGYGVSNDPNVIGPGLGLRFGGVASYGFYLGLSGLVHFGSSDEGEPDVHHYSQSLRAELGYEIDLGPLDVRPTLRAGGSHVTTPRDVSGSFWSPELAAGATLLVRLDGPYVGFDAEARVLTRLVQNGDTLYTVSGIAAYWVAGYRF
jgi:hypothetical protein